MSKEEETTTMGICLSKALKERVRKTAKRRHCTITHIVEEAIEEKCRTLEKQWRDEDRQREEDKRAAKETRQQRQMRQMGDIAPVPISSLDIEDAPVQPVEDGLTTLYEQHAKRIYEVLNNPTEKRLRVAEALAAVRKERPLTYPDDKTILIALETIIMKLRAQQPQPPATDDSGRTINPNQLKSFGDIPVDPK